LHEFRIAHRFPTENITLSTSLNGSVSSCGPIRGKNP
jgi:hypothetical protein